MFQLECCNQQEVVWIVKVVVCVKGNLGLKDFERMICWLEKGFDKVQQCQVLYKFVCFLDVLLVLEWVDDIQQVIEVYQVVIIVGEIGLGKMMQIFKICMNVGWGICGVIGYIQF